MQKPSQRNKRDKKFADPSSFFYRTWKIQQRRRERQEAPE